MGAIPPVVGIRTATSSRGDEWEGGCFLAHKVPVSNSVIFVRKCFPYLQYMSVFLCIFSFTLRNKYFNEDKKICFFW